MVAPHPLQGFEPPALRHHRYDFAGQGRTVVFVLMLLFVTAAATYRWLHLARPPLSTAPAPENFVHVSRVGLVTITSPEDIDWYVGNKAKVVLATLNQNNEEIARLYSRIREITGRLSSNASPGSTEAAAKLLASIQCASGGEMLPASRSQRLPNLRELQNLLQALATDVASARSLDLQRREWVDDLDEAISHVARHAAWRFESETSSAEAVRELRASVQELRERFAAGPAVRLVADRTGTDGEPLTAKARELTFQLGAHLAHLDAWLERQADPMAPFDHLAVGSGAAASSATSTSIDELRTHVARLIAVQAEQRDAVLSLRPPVKLTFFWMSPHGVMAEVLFWGFFGVLTNLMLNVSESVRRKQFRPAELTVILTKLLYGPLVSLVLCLVILTGLMNLGGYEMRAWSLPLVSFLFGFSARKSAALIDRLGEKIFGAAEKSIEEGPEAVARARQQTLERYLAILKPVTLAELRATAKQVAEDTVRNIVQQNEAIR